MIFKNRIFRWVAIILLILISLFVILFVAIQIPRVQTYVVDKLTNQLSNQLNTTISIKKVDIDFFKTVVLEEVYIADQKQDTLLYAGRLAGDVSLFSLFDKKIAFNAIELNQATLNLIKGKNDSTFNHTFILEAFANSSNEDPSNKWDFSLNSLKIRSSEIGVQNFSKGQDFQSSIGYVDIEVGDLDLANKSIVVDEAMFSNNSFTIKKIPSKSIREISEDKIDAPMVFPNTDWAIQVMHMGSEKTKVGYKDLRYNESEGKLKNIEIQDLEFELSDFSWQKDRIETKLDEMSFSESSGFDLKDMQIDFSLTPNELNVVKAKLVTADSQIDIAGQVTMNEFEDLLSGNSSKVDMKFNKTAIGFGDLRKVESFVGDIPFINSELNQKFRLNGEIAGDLKRLETKELNVDINDQFTLNVAGVIMNIDNKDQLEFDLNQIELSTSYDDLMELTEEVVIPKGFQSWGAMKLQGAANGKLDDFNVQALNLETSTGPALQLSGNIRNASKPKEITYDLERVHLTTRVEDIQGFSNATLPTQINSLGKIQYEGVLSGDLFDFEVNGSFDTELGGLTSDLILRYNSDYSSASYKGDLNLKDFSLGALVSDSIQLGNANMFVEVDGAGLTLDSLEGEYVVKVQDLIFKDYQYQNVDIQAEAADQVVKLDLNSQDSNAKILASGEINYQTHSPKYDIDLDVDSINLHTLNFSKNIFGISATGKVLGEGTTLHNLDGDVFLEKFAINRNGKFYESDTMSIALQQKGSLNNLLLKSSFAKANVTGNYALIDLPAFGAYYVNRFYEISNIVPLADSLLLVADSLLRDDPIFNFDVTLDDAEPLILLDFLPFDELGYTQLKGDFDAQKQSLALDGKIDFIKYDNFQSKSIFIQSSGDDAHINTSIQIDSLQLNARYFPLTLIDTKIGNDSLLLETNIKEGMSELLHFGGALTDVGDSYLFRFQNELVLNDTIWNINSNNSISYEGKSLNIQNLDGNRNGQSVQVETVKGTLTDDVNILFDNFELSGLSRFINIKGTIGGLLSGNVQLQDPLNNLAYTAHVNVPALSLDSTVIGELKIDADQMASSKNIALDISLLGAENNITSTGMYNLKTKALDIQTDVEALEMVLLDPFLTNILRESTGKLGGRFEISGTSDIPQVNGDIELQDINTTILFTNTRYRIENQNIKFDSEKFNLDNIILVDREEKKAQLNGQILHENFRNFGLDLKIDTDEFQFLNTTAKDNPLFYGNLLLRASIIAKGPLSEPAVDINARTLPSSTFYLSPFSEASTIAYDDYIIIGNPNIFNEEEGEQATYQIKNSFPFDVKLNLDLTDDLDFNIIMDPLTGDRLSCHGNSTLAIYMKPSGSIELFGNYLVSSGKYHFSYGQLLKRTFDLEEGGLVFFNGDPLNARFNVKANYDTYATPYELIKSQTNLSEIEIQETQKRQLTRVVLDISGDLSKPQFQFDLLIPERSTTSVSSSIDQKLFQLRSNPNELSRQVFGLLLFNSFIASDNNPLLVDSGKTAALSSLSSLFSSQLNQLADQYIKGVEINIDVSSYNSELATTGGTTVTEFGVGVTKKLFNNRLAIQTGGNVNVNADDFSAITGDFLLQYSLTKNGNYLVKFFRKSDYDIINDTNSAQNGVSILMKKEIDRTKKKQKKE